MVELEIKRHKDKFEVAVFPSKRRGDGSSYSNTIDRDPNKIAQVLIDLETVDDFPIFEAVKIYLQRRKNKDWLGF